MNGYSDLQESGETYDESQSLADTYLEEETEITNEINEWLSDSEFVVLERHFDRVYAQCEYFPHIELGDFDEDSED